MVNIIELSSKTLFGIINDILDLSKVEAGKAELNPEYANIYDLFNEISMLLETIARRKGLRLTTSIENGMPSEVFIDKIHLMQL